MRTFLGAFWSIITDGVVLGSDAGDGVRCVRRSGCVGMGAGVIGV
jgi:hypothetical protein